MSSSNQIQTRACMYASVCAEEEVGIGRTDGLSAPVVVVVVVKTETS